MTFDASEKSVYGGQPVEFFHFTMGSTHWYLTSGDIAATISGHSYTPASIKREDMSFSEEDSSGNLVVTLPKDNAVGALFIAFVPPAPVTVVAYRKHRTDSTVQQFFSGEVLGPTFDATTVKLTCGSISQALKRSVPSLVFQSQCPLVLFGPRCGLAKATWSRSATITAVSLATLTALGFLLDPSGAACASGYYLNGWVELASGDKRFIVGQVGTTVTLMSAFPAGSIGVGSVVTIFAGCDRTEATCNTKFNNLDRHLGHPRIPYRNPYEKGTA